MSEANAEITVVEEGLKLAPSAAEEIINNENDQFREIEKRLIDRRRWSVQYEAIFRWVTTGDYYRFRYNRAATECQEEEPFGGAKGPIFVPQVYPVLTPVTLWKTQKEM